MRFIYNEHHDHTSFTAIPENDRERNGLRAQGPYSPIRLQNNKLIVKYVSKKVLHPDIIAAICITAFYPFIHHSAKMPFPVSKRFADGLQMDILPQHDKIDGVYRATEPITIDNIDINLEPYTKGSNTVIAYGGGVDSTAIACLFPEYDLIHSIDLDTTDYAVQKFVEDNLDNKIHMIETNCKHLAAPRGFTAFTNIYITPLIMSADLNMKNIMCGAVLGSTCLPKGIKYFPQFDKTRRNRWERFYNHIGLCMFSPIGGCSELITSKIICDYNLQDKAIYCDVNDGHPCNKCTKCLRKQLELAYHGAERSFETFEEHFVTKFLNQRPLFCGDMFIETIKTLLRRLKDTSGGSMESEKEDDVESEKEAEVESEKEAEEESEKEDDVDSEKEAEVESEKETDVESEKEDDVESEKEDDVESEKEDDVESEKEAEIESEKESEKEVEVESEKEVEVESEKEAGVDSEKEAEKEVEVESEKEAEVESEKEDDVVSEKEAEVESENEADVESEKEDDVESEKEDDVVSEKEADVESEKEAEVESENEDDVVSEKEEDVVSEKEEDVVSEKEEDEVSEKDEDVVSEKEEESRAKMINILQYMSDAISDVIQTETNLFNKIYAKSFQYFPDDIKDILIKRLTHYADIMSTEEEEYLEKWDMSVKPKDIIVPIETEPSMLRTIQIEVESSMLRTIPIETELSMLRKENIRLKITTDKMRHYLLQAMELIDSAEMVGTKLYKSNVA